MRLAQDRKGRRVTQETYIQQRVEMVDDDENYTVFAKVVICEFNI